VTAPRLKAADRTNEVAAQRASAIRKFVTTLAASQARRDALTRLAANDNIPQQDVHMKTRDANDTRS